MKSIHPLRLTLASFTITAAAAFAQTPATPSTTDAVTTPAQNAPAAAATPEADPAAPAAPATPLLPASKILPTSDATTPTGATLTGSLEAGRVASTIQTQELDQRDELLKELADRVAAADRRVSELRQNAANLDDTGKKILETAAAEYQKMKDKLQQSMESARSAERTHWDRARARLATDYAFYVASVGGVEVALPN